MHRAFLSTVSSLSLEPSETVRGASIAFSDPVIGTFCRKRVGTRELSLDETLGVLGDRVTQRIVALPAPPVVTQVAGSYKRTRRMRALRFKALSLAELNRPIDRTTLVDAPIVFPRDGIATVKIDRLQIRRDRRRRQVLATMLVLILFVVWWIA